MEVQAMILSPARTVPLAPWATTPETQLLIVAEEHGRPRNPQQA
jgi:hypothetical protein